jgi:hypothetical protein
MTNTDFLVMIQAFTARRAVPASAVRGRGNKGSTDAARRFLARVQLPAFATSDVGVFSKALDRTTDQLRNALPVGARHWGIARKVLNLFLRDCFYTSYLNDAFRLKIAESLYELPLDSITGTNLRKCAGVNVPRWAGVKHLTPQMSDAYQQAATIEAARLGMARVHFDARWWARGDGEGTGRG